MSPPRPVAIAAVAAFAVVAGLSAAADADDRGKRSQGARPRAEPRRAGKIVRVERPRRIARGTPRVCQVTAPADHHGNCYGRPPAVGEVALVFDNEGYQGRLRVTVVRAISDSCGNEINWEYDFETLAGVFDSSQQATQQWVLFDLDLGDERGRSLETSPIPPPSGRPNETVWAAFDRTGDDTADLVLTAYSCDADGNPTSGYPPQGYCMEYWAQDSRDWLRLRVDAVRTCP